MRAAQRRAKAVASWKAASPRRRRHITLEPRWPAIELQSAMASPATNSVQPPGTLRSRTESRPRIVDLWWTLRDYAKRVWDNSGEDNVLFMAGGIAFNILLAAVPFFLLLATALVYLLNQSPDTTSAEVLTIVVKFLPPHPPRDSGPAAANLHHG